MDSTPRFELSSAVNMGTKQIQVLSTLISLSLTWGTSVVAIVDPYSPSLC